MTIILCVGLVLKWKFGACLKKLTLLLGRPLLLCGEKGCCTLGLIDVDASTLNRCEIEMTTHNSLTETLVEPLEAEEDRIVIKQEYSISEMCKLWKALEVDSPGIISVITLILIEKAEEIEEKEEAEEEKDRLKQI